MASNNVIVRLVVVVVFLSAVQTKRYRQQLHPINEFKDLELGVTRGFGKRALGMHIIHKQKPPPDRELVDRSQRGLQEMEIPVARGFGKRNGDVDLNTIRFLEEWENVKVKLENLKLSQEEENE